ncbi:AAA family ATPase [Pseudomonas aeruginosa]
MYIRRFSIENIRSISNASMEFDRGKEAGWHVILGSNGAGKSSLIRSFSLLAMGEKEAYASRQDFSRWIRSGFDQAIISGSFHMDYRFDVLSGGGGQPPVKPINAQVKINWSDTSYARQAEVTYTGERVKRTIWGTGQGWFCASFGPFRRFTGGDRIYDRLFVSNKRLAPHLTALGEDVALTEALGWLTSLYVQSLQDAKQHSPSQAGENLSNIINFLNESGFLPHGARITEITNETALVTDGNGAVVPLDQLSDGYRSALSLVVELLRQMYELYGPDTMRIAMLSQPGTIQTSGVVAIDEVDAHLHPTWQRDIGRWLTRSFPKVQFIVTTHSPIVCRSVATEDGALKGTVWKLPAPGSDEEFRQVQGLELSQLVYGDVLDAFSTDLFGKNVVRSQAGNLKLERLAELNIKAINSGLNETETIERKELRKVFPMDAGTTCSE